MTLTTLHATQSHGPGRIAFAARQYDGTCLVGSYGGMVASSALPGAVDLSRNELAHMAIAGVTATPRLVVWSLAAVQPLHDLVVVSKLGWPQWHSSRELAAECKEPDIHAAMYARGIDYDFDDKKASDVAGALARLAYSLGEAEMEQRA